MKLPKHKCGLYISHNECRDYYQTVREYLWYMNGEPNWPTEEERQKAIDTNEIWEIQWHPETPVGFYRVAAATLEAALTLANTVDSVKW